MIEGLRPREVLKKMHAVPYPDLSAQFGFRRKVHMRHIAAITSSYAFDGVTAFTVSEETGTFHIFEKGKIIFSTVPEEMGQQASEGIVFINTSPIKQES